MWNTIDSCIKRVGEKYFEKSRVADIRKKKHDFGIMKFKVCLCLKCALSKHSKEVSILMIGSIIIKLELKLKEW